MSLPERALRIHRYDEPFGPKNEAPSKIFLDANVVMNIHENAIALRSAKGGHIRGRRHPQLLAFLARARAARTKLLLTVAVLEEVYHKYTARIIDGIIVANKPKSEKDFRARYPNEYKLAKENALKLTNDVLNEVCKYAAVVAPSNWRGDQEIALGEKLCEAFLELVQLCHEIGGKDALHIVQARQMDCTAFVSQDSDFKCVPEIVVYCKGP